MQRHVSITANFPTQGVEFVTPQTDWHDFNPTPLPCAAAEVLDFVAALSRAFMAAGKAWPDLVALGFWLRPAAIRQQLAGYQAHSPLGLTFHLVPSNVPTLALYSWLVALLMGNSAIVRLSRRVDPVQQAALACVATLLAEPQWQAIACRVRFIRYAHDETMTAVFSRACQLRVIWGGDATVQQIRAIPLSPQAREMVFPDRHSAAVLSSSGLQSLSAEQRSQQLRALAQDISQFNQQACASPTSLIWLAPPAAWLREEVIVALAEPFLHEPAYGMSRLVNSQLALATAAASRLHAHLGLHLLQSGEKAAPEVVTTFGGGVLIERQYANLTGWLADGDHFQTCVCLGIHPTEILKYLACYPITRIDRLVTAGQALAFDWFWDGQDLLAGMSRVSRAG